MSELGGMCAWDLGVKINHHGKGCATATHAVSCMPIPLILNVFLHADVTAKTVSEEYTPLHLAARFIPQKTTCSTEGARVVPDTDGSSDDVNTVINYLKQCKGVDVSLVKTLL